MGFIEAILVGAGLAFVAVLGFGVFIVLIRYFGWDRR
jgi:hypothetical protein